MLRRSIDIGEVPKVLEAAHDSPCGGHFAGLLTAYKALRTGYYWSTMFKESYEHARKCNSCQRYSCKDVRLGMPLRPSLPLAPFEKWGIKYVGQVHPASSRQTNYIVVATEYLTKWAEAKVVKKDDAKTTAMFLYENIITRYGCPKALVSDRGSHFVINHQFSAPYYLLTNGQTKQTNQTLCRILRKPVNDSKRDWDAKLRATLWAYRMTYKVTTHTTPFSLVYGIEAILPIEFEVEILRIAVEERLDASKSIEHRLEVLEGLSAARMLSAHYVETPQRRRKMTFDKKQMIRTFKVGQWVLLRDDRHKDFMGKFDALWLSPYVVKELFANGSLLLETLAGDVFPTRTNTERCKEYKV